MSRRWNTFAWSVLAFVFIAMSVYLVMNPTRTGVVVNYRFSSTNWWAGLPIYGSGTGGFLYFPQFAVAFTPFNLVRPEILGELFWRTFGFGLFGWVLWKLAQIKQLSGRLRSAPPIFLPIVLLAVPASLASLSNGQTNLPLSATLVLTVLALRSQDWITASLWIFLAVILKPISVAPWLLVFAVFPAMRKPLLIGVLPMAALGFAHPDFHYAWDRWVKCLEKILHAYTPENLRVSDIFGAISRAGVGIPPLMEKGVRAAASMGALAWVWQSYQTKGLAGASWALWVATALVFTLFNPRAETNSYVLISPLLAFAAVSYWREGEGDKWKGWVLAAACIALMCDGMGLWIYKATDVWFKPLIVLLASPLLFRMPRQWEVKLRDST